MAINAIYPSEADHEQNNRRSPYDVMMPHPAIVYSHPSLYSHEDAVARLKKLMPEEHNGYGQFVDIEAKFHDKTIYTKSMEENIKEAHPPFGRGEVNIDFSYADKFAPKLTKSYSRELEEAKEQINKRYFGENVTLQSSRRRSI